MARRSFLLLLLSFAAAAALSSCAFLGRPQRPAWRTQAEEACLAERRVQPSAYVQLARELDGPGICGLTRPFKVAALENGAVAFNAVATLDCAMVAELDQWLADVVQPAASARFGQKVTQINSMGSYSCRGMNNRSGAALSEHAFGNALDIGGFVLADGREISVVRDWTHGDPAARAFLLDVHGGSCRHFSTVLAPGSNPFHYNHIHVDLAMRGQSGGHICKPEPKEIESALPTLKGPAPSDDDDADAREGPPRGAFEGEGAGGRAGAIGAFSAPLPPRRDR
jgi:hypothetical protein